MSERLPLGARRLASLLSAVPLFAAGGLLGLLADVPRPWGVGVSVALIAVGVGLRWGRSALVRATAPGPVLLALAFGALSSPLSLLAELAAGLAGLAFLLWLADDPARPRGTVGLAATSFLVPSLALGIAWGSALLLPSEAAPVGVAAGLLVFAIGALAFLAVRPSLLDAEAPVTS